MSLPCDPKQAQRIRKFVFDEHGQLYGFLKKRVTSVIKDFCDEHNVPEQVVLTSEDEPPGSPGASIADSATES